MRLPYLPAPVDAKAPNIDRYGDPEPLLQGASPGARFAGKHFPAFLSAYGGNQAVDWAMDCARLICESASNAEYHFTDDAGTKLVPVIGAPSDQEPDKRAPNDLTYLFSQPNPYQDYVELMELSVVDLLFTGEFLWWKFKPGPDGRPLALYRLNPSNVDVLPGENRLIAAYEYRGPGTTQPIRIPFDQIIHTKLPNPHDPYRGLGLVQGATRAFDIELSLTDTQAQFFEQGTFLGGVVSSERRVPDPVFQKIKRQFNALYSGRRNAGKVAVLEAGLKFQTVQSTAVEANFEALAKLSRDRIAHLFRVPLPLIGNLENANYKMAEAQRIFDTKTMRPLLNRIQRRVTQDLTGPGWDLAYEIDYQYVMPDEDRLKLAEAVATLPGIKVSEVRKQAGLPLLGDERDEIVLNLRDPNEPHPDPAAGGTNADQPAPQRLSINGNGGRPPNGENVPTIAPPAPSGKAASEDPNDRYVTPQKPHGDRPPDPLNHARTRAVDRAAATVQEELAVLVAQLRADLAAELGAPEVKAMKKPDRADPDQGLAARIRSSAAWGRFSDALGELLGSRAADLIEEAETHHTILGFEPQDGDDLVAIGRELAYRPEGVRSITSTLRERVLREVREGVRRGYSPEQVVAGVEGEGFAGLRQLSEDWAKGQAETIAITEASVYYNEGVLRTAERAGTPTVLVLDGEDYDKPCEEAHGSVWTVSQARANSIEHPRCRRSFIPIGSSS